MEGKNRSVVFCQGDKKELEEITNREYEFLKPEYIVSHQDREIYAGEVLPTFIYAYEPRGNGGPVTHETLMDSLRYKAAERGADAVIHFYSTTDGNNVFAGYARGTPVREIKK